MIKNTLITINRRVKKLFKGEYPISYIIYEIFRDYLENKKFPYKMYQFFLRKRYKKINLAKLLEIPTYDGMGQSTHPTITVFGNKKYFALTPFPYGNDKYENPCTYILKNDSEFIPVGENPVSKPNDNGNNLIYLSDPNLYVYNDEMYLMYRECSYISQTEYIANIYRKKYKSDESWEKEELLFRSDLGAMSPTYMEVKNICYIYYVIFYNNETVLCRRKYLGGEEEILKVNNIPEGYMLWHIDFAKIDDKYYGLFTMSIDHQGGATKLYRAVSQDGKEWNVLSEIVIDLSRKKISKTYKATISKNINNTYDLYVSLRRRDRCWFIYKIENYDIMKEYL